MNYNCLLYQQPKKSKTDSTAKRKTNNTQEQTKPFFPKDRQAKRREAEDNELGQEEPENGEEQPKDELSALALDEVNGKSPLKILRLF